MQHVADMFQRIFSISKSLQNEICQWKTTNCLEKEDNSKILRYEENEDLHYNNESLNYVEKILQGIVQKH